MNLVRKAIVSTALIGATITGGAVGATMLNSSASAQSATTSATSTTGSSSAAAPAAKPDPSKGGHHKANGITETLLTGSVKTSVEKAAKAAVPGGTIQRVENDAEGATYEAHMTKADGSEVTVKVNAAFKVAGIETGPAHR